MQLLPAARPASKPDEFAPDGSEIRFLVCSDVASTVHVTLATNQVSRPVAHRTVTEHWLFVQGRGKLWRRDAIGEERIDEVGPGAALVIEPGTSFQFRNIGDGPMRVVITTIPPWPAGDEAEPVPGRWPMTVSDWHPAQVRD